MSTAKQIAMKTPASRFEMAPRTMARDAMRGCWLSYLRSAQLSMASDAARAVVMATTIQKRSMRRGCPSVASSAPMSANGRSNTV